MTGCAVCRRPVCDLCVGQIDYVSFCPPHFTQEEARIRSHSYGLPPLPAPVTVVELLLGVWAVVGAFAPFMTWYRTLVQTQTGTNIIHESGWEAGPVAALASVALLVSGITLGVMVGVRTVRPRWVAAEPVSQTSLGLGLTAVALLGLVAALRSSGFGVGLYVGVTSAALVLFLGRRLQRTLPQRARPR